MTKNIIILILILALIAVSLIFFVHETLHAFEIKKLNQTMIEKVRDKDVVLAGFIAGYDKLWRHFQIFTWEYQNLLIEQEVAYEIEGWEKFKITGYSINDVAQGTTDIVRVGLSLNDPAVSKLPIIAVDPDVVPLYSIVEIEGLGAFIALDTGGAIKGNHVEILFDSKQKAIEFGVCENVKVRVLKRVEIEIFLEVINGR